MNTPTITHPTVNYHDVRGALLRIEDNQALIAVYAALTDQASELFDSVTDARVTLGHTHETTLRLRQRRSDVADLADEVRIALAIRGIG